MKDINKLVISGGAANVYYILGGLDILYDKSKLQNIQCYSGASIGALVCVLLNLDWTPRKIADKLSDITSKGVIFTSLAFSFLNTPGINNQV